MITTIFMIALIIWIVQNLLINMFFVLPHNKQIHEKNKYIWSVYEKLEKILDQIQNEIDTESYRNVRK
jgi:hypothetical protein